MFLVLVVVVGPVPLALALVRRWGSEQHSATENLLAGLVFSVAAQVTIGLTLGFLGLYTLVPLIVCEALFLILGVELVRRWGAPRILTTRPLNAIEAGALLVVLIAGALGMADLVVHPTRNFDSLAYHLPVMARWVSAGQLQVFTELGQVAFYPSHWELLSSFLVLAVRQDLLVAMPNLLAWAQLGLAILLLARRLGANRESAVVASSLVLLMPSILSRLDAIQPDIALAATFLTVFGFALRRRSAGRHLDVAVVLVALGLLAGLKLSGPIFVLMLLPLLILGPGLEWVSGAMILRRLNPARAGVGRGLTAAVASFAFLLGVVWYLRNWIVLGNPFGDLQISLAGIRIFEGSITRAELQRGSLANTFELARGNDWAVLGTVLWTWLGVGALLLLLSSLLVLRMRTAELPVRRARVLIGAILLICIGLYWRTPYGGDNGTHGWQVTAWIEVGLRYGFPAIALLGVLGAVGLSRSTWLVRIGLVVLVVTAVMTVLKELIPNLWVLVVVVGAAWAVAVSAQRSVPRPRWIMLASVTGLLLVAGALGLARENREARKHGAFGGIIEVLATELGHDDIVAVVHSQKLHLAAGMDWRRRVELPALPASGQESAWVEELRRRGVTAVLVGHKEPAADEAGDVTRVQRFIRESGSFELVADYQSMSKDLALFRLVR
jgi:hypothetical protein